MFYLRVQGYNTETCKITEVTAKFDDDGKLLNPRDVARNSQFGWGKWQSSEKIPCSFGNCWWCTSAGHGGYILVTQADQDFYIEPACNVEHLRGSFRVFEFEEDCDWAVLEYFDPKARAHSMKRRNGNLERAGEPPETEEKYMEGIIQTLKQYRPGVLKVPGAAGIGDKP